MTELADQEWAMISLAIVVVLIAQPVHVFRTSGGNGMRSAGGLGFLAWVLLTAIASIGIDYGGTRTLFISSQCWFWPYAFFIGNNILRIKNNDGFLGVGSLLNFAAFGLAIASAAYNTHNPHDEVSRACCIVGVTIMTLIFVGAGLLRRSIEFDYNYWA